MTTLVRRARIGVVSRALVAFGLLAPSAAVMLSATTASADSMDPTPERFVTQPTWSYGGKTMSLQSLGTSCQAIAGNPGGALKTLDAAASKIAGKTVTLGANVLTPLACQPNNVAFTNFISELGFATAPNAFHPARTTGFGGFAFTFEASYTNINTNAVAGGVAYWQQGTQGSVNPQTGNASSYNTSPDSVIQVYSLKGRKGLPLGFEITGDVSYIADTIMWTAGADIRWSLLEGFRTGWPSYLPDISGGGGVRTLTGTSKFSLTTVGIDAQISKPITLADTSVLSPYVGYQRLYIFGDSSTVDLAPNVDALKQCGYNGTQGTTYNTAGQAMTGQPSCVNNIPGTNTPNTLDFNQYATFNQVRISRDRMIVGLNYRYEVLYLAGQFLFDLIPPSSENASLVGGRQWTTSLEAGVYF